MKVIAFPPPRTIAGREFNMCTIMNEFVFTMPAWREKQNHRLTMAIMLKFPEGVAGHTLASVTVTDDEHEFIEKGMRVEGQLNAQINVYYNHCLSAVYNAEAST